MRLLIASLLLAAALVTPARAQGVVRDSFDGPEPTLRPAGADVHYKLEAHQSVPQGAHGGRGCEWLRITGSSGTFVYFSRVITPARVISELAPSVWVKSDRAGVQMMVRVVLPRSLDPDTGKPLTVRILGSDYREVGSWQQLRVEALPLAVERQVRLLRTRVGPTVDGREAYVDRVLLNVYGGQGTTNVWVDDLEIAGVVAPAPSRVPTASVTDVRPQLMADRSATWPGGQGMPRVEMKQSLLLVNGVPFFPRAIEHRGEPLARLQALGFNAVRLSQPASSELLREAMGLGLWLIVPPPSARELESRLGDGSMPKFGTLFDPVLAWDLGSGLATSDLEATRRWAKLVQAADPRARPIVCDPESDLKSYSRPPLSIMVARREPLCTSLNFKQYSQWLHDRGELALGGTPLWAVIQTEPAPQLMEQIALLSENRAPAVELHEGQIRALVHCALASRARGLCFASNNRLDGTDPQSERRAAVLELMNLELQLIQRWPAAGTFSPNADTTDPHVTGAVIETDHSRLLLPIYAPKGSQFVMGNASTGMLSFLVTGVPEGNNVYELAPTSLRRLGAIRKTGGTRVNLGDAEGESLRDSLVMFVQAQDQQIVRAINNTIVKSRARASELARRIASDELVEVEVTEQHLAETGRAVPATARPRASAQENLRKCESLLKLGTPESQAEAYYQARTAQQFLREIRRGHWERAVDDTVRPLAEPLTTSFVTLSEHYRLSHELTTAPRSANRLTEGGFENLQAMLAGGWRYFQHAAPTANASADASAPPPITTTVELAPEAAHSGQLGLRLRALPSDAKRKPVVVETPPLWIVSAPVSVEQGDVVAIEGWVRIGQPISGSVDGLLIVDSLGGQPLADRFLSGEKWQQFTMVRAAPRSGPMAVTIALTGLGEACLDDLSIQIIERARPAAPLQAQGTASTAAPSRGS